MLKSLIVKNFAIIEDVTVDFKPLMTAITGQTGAGKSLIIDAISLLLGERADSSMVRYGENEAVIEGFFSPLNANIKKELTKLGVSFQNELKIVRRISTNGKNVIKVNDKNITLVELKNLGFLLGDIHVQHDTYRLINKDTYLSFIDDYNDADFLKLFNDYIIKREKYLVALKNYHFALKRNKELNEQIDYLIFQRDELQALALKKGLDVELENEIGKLTNFDKIYQNLNQCYQNLTDNLNLDSLYEAKAELENIGSFDDLYQKNAEILNDAYYQIEDVKSYLFKVKDSLDFDPQYLEDLNSKLFEINKIKAKYHMNLDELINYLADLDFKVSLATNFDEAIKDLYRKVSDEFNLLSKAGLVLHEWRQQKALHLTKAIKKEAADLALDNFQFNVSFSNIKVDDCLNNEPFKENGLDEIDFMVSFNLGEPLKPLARVASGGELSRLMLAFKSLYVREHDLSFVVFDEIDSGLSGEVARKISLKMKEISRKTMVLAITHLANVAAAADNQFYIYKEENGSRTNTIVKELSFDERVKEIALMLSGLKLSPAMLETAKMLLENKE